MNLRNLLSFSLLMLLFSVQSIYAQQQRVFRVVEFGEDPLDLTAREVDKRDGNGEVYAIIKVTSENPDDNLREYNFKFGYLKHIVEERDNQLFVFVQRNAKRVTIQRSGFRTISDYDLQTTIQPGKTYRMVLSAEAKKIQKQMVRFNVEPKGVQATVNIRRNDGNEGEKLLGFVDPATGSLAKTLEYGTYTYSVRAVDYDDSDGVITLADKSKIHVENIRLHGHFGTITLRVSQDAEIYVDGEKKGTRTWTGNLLAGNHTVECRQYNHKSSTQYISVKEGETLTLDLTPPTPITGVLSVISTPLDADIKIDGKDYGKTPNVITDLLVGLHTVTLSKSGHEAVSQQVDVKENQDAELNLTLKQQATPQQGNLSAGSQPNGTSSGQTETITVKNNGKTVSFKMIRVEAGTFVMGDINSSSDEKPIHSVTLTNDYYIGETEVTQELWTAVMGDNPSYLKGEKNPVEKVSWNDCQVFIKKLNALTGKNFRLPTEAEWEYAARGGNKSKNYTYAGSNNIKDVAWYFWNTNDKTHPVAQKLPNELDIYDMSGNVWEWCADWYGKDYYSNSPATNPTGPSSGSDRVRRGGGWDRYAGGCRSANRDDNTPSSRSNHLGLRLAL